MTSKPPEDKTDIIVERHEFTRIIDNLLKMPPNKCSKSQDRQEEIF